MSSIQNSTRKIKQDLAEIANELGGITIERMNQAHNNNH